MAAPSLWSWDQNVTTTLPSPDAGVGRRTHTHMQTSDYGREPSHSHRLRGLAFSVACHEVCVRAPQSSRLEAKLGRRCLSLRPPRRGLAPRLVQAGDDDSSSPAYETWGWKPQEVNRPKKCRASVALKARPMPCSGCPDKLQATHPERRRPCGSLLSASIKIKRANSSQDGRAPRQAERGQHFISLLHLRKDTELPSSVGAGRVPVVGPGFEAGPIMDDAAGERTTR
jgi:hypothetical protein